MVVYMPSPHVYQVHLSPAPPFSTNMTIVSNDPTWWPTISSYLVSSYSLVASFVVVTYDWALTLGQEVELVWRQRWSLMTVLYLSVRYLGILYAALYMLSSVTAISLTDTQCLVIYNVRNWTGVLVFTMLFVIMVTRLHAMYQRSRRILTFLIVIFLAVNIFSGVVTVMTTMYASGEELILSGTHQCSIGYVKNDVLLLGSITWILGIVWEFLSLCLALWIAVKHFRELRQHSTGGIMEDCFTVLMKTHVLYFASFGAVSCFSLIINLSPTFSADGFSPEAEIFSCFLQIFTVVQMFVLGPRLVLSVREFHAKLVADSDAATGMTSIAFQERVHISTGSGV
ncbi:hypothetical protein BDR03DRAFT_963719 [Suillus americanus]|nr:hypothetical protein BDR03DRAFT_963719 [Suillus americanus]